MVVFNIFLLVMPCILYCIGQKYHEMIYSADKFHLSSV